jgi:hypothetical protein
MAGGGIGEAALIGAVIGGGSSALTGRDPLQGALLGGLTGGAGAGISNLLGGVTPALAPELAVGADTGIAAGINSAASAASPTGLAALQSTAVPQSVLDQSIAQEMALNKPVTQLLVDPGVYAAPVSPTTQAAIEQSIAGDPSFSHRISQVAPTVQPQTPVFDAIKSLGTSIGDNQKGTTTQALKDIGSSVLGKIGDNPVPYALSGIVPLAMLDPKKTDATPVEKYEGPLSKFKYDPNTFQPYTPQPPNPVYRPVYNSYGLPTIYAAAGGSVEQMSQANSVGANTGYPQADILGHAYSTPWQTPVSQNVVAGVADTGVNPITGQMAFAGGGIADLGSYSDGGRMLKGPGDGMSDSIPATIANKRPARLANEEFVVPADVVSHLGNGSSDAGAKQLYAMMDRVRKARTGTKQQGREINPTKYMPA